MTEPQATAPERNEALRNILGQVLTLVGGVVILIALTAVTEMVIGGPAWLAVVAGLVEVGIAAYPKCSVSWVLRFIVTLFGGITLFFGVLSLAGWS